MGNCQNIPNDSQKSINLKSKHKTHLIIRSNTWQRDSYGLFDYECKSLLRKNFKTSFSGKVIRAGEDVQLRKDNLAVKAPSKAAEIELINVVQKDGLYWMMPSTNPAQNDINATAGEEGLWIVIKSLMQGSPDSRGYKLTEGEIIKIGRARFLIKELRILGARDSKVKAKGKNKEIGSIALDDNRKSEAESLNSINQKTNPIACKICLAEGSDESVGPFISPCLCAGTMKHVHLKCLQKWLQSRIQTKKNGAATSFHWKAFECELCKQAYPMQLEAESRKYDLVEIPKPESGAYILLEIFHKDLNQPRGVHLISMEAKSSVRLGRGNDSDIKITDISVSRCHAIIKMEKGNFYIEDNDSKFGTLVLVQKPIAITNEFSNVSIQVGRTVLNLSLRKAAKTAGCLPSSKVPTDVDEISDEEFQDGYQGSVRTREVANSPQSHENNNDSDEESDRNSQDERDEDEIVQGHMNAHNS